MSAHAGTTPPPPPALARRDFLRLGALAGLGLTTLATDPRTAHADDASAIPAEFPRHAADDVREIVAVAHTDLERVRALVSTRPALARASWDWGYGDWETPLGAASHMGRRDIAELLLAHGARPNVFSAAMLGQLEVVRAFVEADVTVASLEGPHGIPLIAHAQRGGDAAREVVAYLESLPGRQDRADAEALTEAERTTLVGTYAFGTASDETLEVTERNGQLRIGRGGANRNLFRVEGFAFRPAGAPDVRVTFRVDAGRAAALTVTDGPLVVHALRRG